MAIFPYRPEDAIKASIEMIGALNEFNAAQKDINDDPVRMGIGINTGAAMLGIIGEEGRHAAGLISDTTNTASRIEGLNKIYGSRILVSGASLEAMVGKVEAKFRLIDRLRLKGKTAVNDIYEVIDWEQKIKGITMDEYLKLFDINLRQYFKGQFGSS